MTARNLARFGWLYANAGVWPGVPARTFAAQGNLNNICIIVPEWELVLVRTGQDRVIDVDLYDSPLRMLHEALSGKKHRLEISPNRR